MYTTFTTHCASCDVEMRFDIEEPDYEVGLLGYSAMYYEDTEHEPDCELDYTNPDVVEQAEMDAAQAYVDTPSEWD